MTLHLVCTNVEGSNHLDKVLPFLSQEAPEFVSALEIHERDIPQFEQALGMSCLFVPMRRNPQGELGGIGIFSRYGIVNSAVYWYDGNPIPLAPSSTDVITPGRRPLIVCDIKKAGVRFRIATTHFVWTPDGTANDAQRIAVQRMFKLLDPLGDLVLCGDLNAPRGREIFQRIEERYRDNIPAHYTTSLDGTLHRAGPLERMVDGLFSTTRYSVKDVRLVFGVSDHAAVVGKIAAPRLSLASSRQLGKLAAQALQLALPEAARTEIAA